MKKQKKTWHLILILIVILGLGTAIKAYATATSETGNTRALPIVLYGKTSAGVLTALLVMEDGTVETTT
jgi:uncharacterized protein YycO